ncbi:hypothetical protein ACF0H5_024452 [Mactra antiquata]
MATTNMPMKSLIKNLRSPSSTGLVTNVTTTNCNNTNVEISQSEDSGTDSLLYNQACQKTNLSETAENTVHIEIAEYPNNSVDTNHGTFLQFEDGNNVKAKSSVILFKWSGSSNKPLHCQTCDMAFSDGDLLREHLKKHEVQEKESKKPFPCKLYKCFKSFETEKSLERHQLTHSGQSMKRCKYCYKVFANKENLDKHLAIHNGQRLYDCSICSEGFVYRQGLESHMQTHREERNFKCVVCLKTFRRRDSLQRHLLRHTNVRTKTHQCVECDKSFFFLFALKKHVRSVHGGEPDGRHCDICGKFIKNRENISRHMMIHDNKRPYQCEVCNQSFVQKQHLLDHMDVHSSQSAYSCKFCGNNFRHRRSLNRHLHKHYTVPVKGVYACSKCDGKFEGEAKIAEHILNKHDKELFCSLCKAKHSDENELADHMLNVHCAIEKEDPELVNKATSTNDHTNEELVNYEHTYAESIEQEAAEELLRIRKYYQPSFDEADHVNTEDPDNGIPQIDKTFVVDELESNETAESIDIVNNDDSGKVIQASIGKDGIVYIICNDSQEFSDIVGKAKQDNGGIVDVTKSDAQYTVDNKNAMKSEQQVLSQTDGVLTSAGHSFAYIDNLPESITQTGAQVIHIPESMKQSGSQIIYSPESFDLSGSQVIHIPECMDSTGSNIILIPESMSQTGSEHSVNVNQTGIQIVDIPKANELNQSGSQIIQIHGTIAQNQSENSEMTHFVAKGDQSDFEVNQIQEIVRHSTDNTNDGSAVTFEVVKRVADTNTSVESDAIPQAASLYITEGSRSLNNDISGNNEPDRSALLQSLIDYAEKIHDEEM